MIGALVAGSEEDAKGIIGKRAKAELQQKPSATYWSALKAYGLVTKRGSLRDFAQRNFPYWQRRQYEAGFGAAPPPPPADWKRMLNVKLTPEEATRLTGYIIGSTKDSLLAWLLSSPAERLAGYCSRPEATDLIGENDLPEAIRLQLRYARHYELLFRPALLLYNQELLKINDEYDQRLLDAAWEQYKNDRAHLLDATKLTAGMLDEYPVDPVTRRFILEWSELVLAGRYQSREAIEMVQLREATVKPGRARLTDKSLARRLNEGETPGITVTMEGVWPIFSYRWGNVVRHLRNLKLSADV